MASTEEKRWWEEEETGKDYLHHSSTYKNEYFDNCDSHDAYYVGPESYNYSTDDEEEVLYDHPKEKKKITAVSGTVPTGNNQPNLLSSGGDNREAFEGSRRDDFSTNAALPDAATNVLQFVDDDGYKCSQDDTNFIEMMEQAEAEQVRTKFLFAMEKQNLNNYLQFFFLPCRLSTLSQRIRLFSRT